VREHNGTILFIMSLFMMAFIQGCAHSAVSREANSQVDTGYINTVNSVSSASEGHISDAYQNTSQTTKGVVLGAVGGALVGSLTTAVGVLPGAASGAILGGAFGKYLDSYTTLADKLENRHVKVFVLGDQVMVVVASDQLFNGQNANIAPTSYSTLDLIAQLINTHHTEYVRVVAYSDSTLSNSVANALTREQANNVVKYLWRRGINTRMLYAVGAGGSHIVTQSSLIDETSMNYRVEISFEKLPL